MSPAMSVGDVYDDAVVVAVETNVISTLRPVRESWPDQQARKCRQTRPTGSRRQVERCRRGAAAPAKGQRFQSFRTNPPDRSLDASSSGSYNDEQRDSISNLQDDQNLIYKGTSFDQIFRQSFIRSHSRTAGLRKSRKMSADVLSADDSPPSPSTRLRAGSDSSLQPSMNPGSFGNAITPARAVIQEESKESSGEEAEDRKRGLQLVSAN